jgi:hypothetical protein
MSELAKHGLSLRDTSTADDVRKSLYLPGEVFVAWFQSSKKMKGGVEDLGISIKRVLREEMSVEQVEAVEMWLACEFRKILY